MPVPIGHSDVAHRLLGWCSHCPDRDVAQECVAWRERALRYSEETVRRSIGGSFLFRPFLKLLSQTPGQWVSRDVICARVGLDRPALAGLVSSAIRRCDGKPPFEKTAVTRGQQSFRVPPEVAAIVLSLAGPSWEPLWPPR